MTVALPWVLTYCGTELKIEPQSGLCAVLLTERAAQVAAFILQEVYHNFHLWFEPMKGSDMIPSLDLSFVLASQYD